MDGIFALIPIGALCVAVTAIIASSVLKIQRMKLEEARLQSGDSNEVSELAQQLSQLQNEMTEVLERLDFAERLLAQEKDAGRLPAVPTQQPPARE